MLVKELIARIPHDTSDRVRDFQRRHQETLRAALRAECRLQLRRGSEHDASSEAARVSVDSTVGYPEQVGNQKIPDDKRLAAILAPLAPQLTSLADAAPIVGNALTTLLSDNAWLDEAAPEARLGLPSLASTESLAKGLLARVHTFDLVKHVLAVDEDVLGHYFARSDSAGQIFLYWGIIGLVAPPLGVTIEALTAVVLAHELAHGYTHLGFDIEGRQWSRAAFGRADRPLVEGLAQYYTDRTLRLCAGRLPGAYEAFVSLTKKQPEAYRAHEDWVKNSTPEAVRAALVAGRQRGMTSHEHFCKDVRTYSRRMSRAGQGDLFEDADAKSDTAGSGDSGEPALEETP